jgi:hypothetical protein
MRCKGSELDFEIQAALRRIRWLPGSRAIADHEPSSTILVQTYTEQAIFTPPASM